MHQNPYVVVKEQSKIGFNLITILYKEVLRVKKGKCPKCKSSEVNTGANIKLKSGSYGYNTIPLGGLFGRQLVLDNYVCIKP